MLEISHQIGEFADNAIERCQVTFSGFGGINGSNCLVCATHDGIRFPKKLEAGNLGLFLDEV
jgi:hypothetical protein